MATARTITIRGAIRSQSGARQILPPRSRRPLPNPPPEYRRRGEVFDRHRQFHLSISEFRLDQTPFPGAPFICIQVCIAADVIASISLVGINASTRQAEPSFAT